MTPDGARDIVVSCRVANDERRQDEDRALAIKYKIQSLAKLDKEARNSSGLSHEKWRLQADRTRLEAQLNGAAFDVLPR